jgi:hypothetical protein
MFYEGKEAPSFERVVMDFLHVVKEPSHIDNFLLAVEAGELPKARADYEQYHDVDQLVNCFLLDMIEDRKPQ